MGTRLLDLPMRTQSAADENTRAGASLLPCLAGIQGVYFLATGIWPLIHLKSFEWVTGPKTDHWLVHTVGVLVAVVGLVLLVAAVRRRIKGEIVLLAVGSALALTGIDVLYVARGVIAPIYLADAAVEVLLVAVWLGAWFRGRPRAQSLYVIPL